MPLNVLNADDLTPFADIDSAKADAMVTHVQALAAREAPCLETTTDEGILAAARAILVGVVLRWHESGNASYSVQAAGPSGYPLETARSRVNAIWASEADALRKLCRDSAGGGSGAFGLDTVGRPIGAHADICAINFGAMYCSCGAILTNLLYPLYEVTDGD